MSKVSNAWGPCSPATLKVTCTNFDHDHFQYGVYTLLGRFHRSLPMVMSSSWLSLITSPCGWRLPRMWDWHHLGLLVSSDHTLSVTIKSLMSWFHIEEYISGQRLTPCGPLPDPLGWRDSLSLFFKSSVEWNEKVVFEFWKIRPRWGTVLFGVATSYFYFLKGKN